MLTPTTGRAPGPRGQRRSRAAAAAAPSLLNPIRLISARSAGNRNIRGRGFPGWARAVTVPTSTNPKPRAPSPDVARASLSNPAASPSGPGNSSPSACTRSTGSRGPSHRRSSPPAPAAPATRISAKPTRCAVSAGSRRSTTRNRSWYSVFPSRLRRLLARLLPSSLLRRSSVQSAAAPLARGSPLCDELGLPGEGVPQRGVGAVRGQQLVVAADLRDLPLVQDHDPVRAGRRGEPVRDHDRGPRRGQLGDGPVHRRLGGQVQGRGGLVEQQD